MYKEFCSADRGSVNILQAQQMPRFMMRGFRLMLPVPRIQFPRNFNFESCYNRHAVITLLLDYVPETDIILLYEIWYLQL
jgi:hypothetical protein